MSKPLKTKAPTYETKPAPSRAGNTTGPQAAKGRALTETLALAKENASEGAKRLTVDVRPELSRRFDEYCRDNDVKKGWIMRALLEDFLTSEGY